MVDKAIYLLSVEPIIPFILAVSAYVFSEGTCTDLFTLRQFWAILSLEFMLQPLTPACFIFFLSRGMDGGSCYM